MSWDIIVQDIPKSVKTVEEIPSEFTPQPIGSKNEIIFKILEIVPEANFENRDWGIIEGKSFSIEINIGNEEVLTSFTFHVRGDKKALDLVSAILDHLNLRAFDSNGIYNPKTSIGSFENWNAYRNFIIYDSKA